MKWIKKISAKWSAQQDDADTTFYKLVSFDLDGNDLPTNMVWEDPEGNRFKVETSEKTE